VRIAIATEDGRVAAHFGRCPAYTLADLNGGAFSNRTELTNPGHEPGRIPAFLHEHSVEVIIAGGMGQRAQGFFNQMGIEQIVGITGTVDEVLSACLNGTLAGGESLCIRGKGLGDGTGHHDENGECDHH